MKKKIWMSILSIIIIPLIFIIINWLRNIGHPNSHIDYMGITIDSIVFILLFNLFFLPMFKVR
ncbi:hypothetical protein JOD45_003282 [Scopulibacillus daqui]|uniref:Uncharacterized protein n=1 Tax=Scopulibacillus daqui TaxID=1469162 RepID=A0ABS2Q4J5_9BACL|nr:hypothetical protein [Scopulibacillus daqui]